MCAGEREKRLMRSCLIALVLCALPAFSECRHQTTFTRAGSILDCAYVQTCEETNPHFMTATLKNTTGHELRTLTFKDPGCMPKFDTAQEAVNRHVSRWYLGTHVLRDARFDTKNLRPAGRSQSRGKCIQSREYPSKGIFIEHFANDDGITKVVHMMGLRGCG